MLNTLTHNLIRNLQDKVDVSVYFKLDAPEGDILELKNVLASLAEVKNVEYCSREEALKKFKERHKDNPILMESLRELGKNPLGAVLNIKAVPQASSHLSSQYESIVNFLSQSKYQKLIDKINYRENKIVIERLSSITQNIRQGGLIASILLILIAVLVTFNTIRLVIYNSREEINVMKLVGATNWFIRGPFIVAGALYGLVSALVVLLVIYPVLWYISPKIAGFLPGSDLLSFFKANFWSILILQISVGIGLGVLSSLVAIRRYLS